MTRTRTRTRTMRILRLLLRLIFAISFLSREYYLDGRILRLLLVTALTPPPPRRHRCCPPPPFISPSRRRRLGCFGRRSAQRPPPNHYASMEDYNYDDTDYDDDSNWNKIKKKKKKNKWNTMTRKDAGNGKNTSRDDGVNLLDPDPNYNHKDKDEERFIETLLMDLHDAAATITATRTQTTLQALQDERAATHTRLATKLGHTTTMTMTTTTAAPTTTTTVLLQEAIAIVAQGLVERDQEARLVVLALVCREHIVFVGPPGTGKSVLGVRLAQLLVTDEDDNTKEEETSPPVFFQRLLTKFTTPEELFGPLSLTALEQDIYRRQTDGYLPTCRIAFLDELFKANASILNTLLTLLNERQFDNGVLLPPTTTEGRTATITTTTTTRREACPLITVIGTANELPDSEELAAVYDRFLFRKEVLPVSDYDGVRDLVRAATTPTTTTTTTTSAAHPKIMNLSPVMEALADVAQHVVLEDAVCDLLRDLRMYLRDDQPASGRRIDISDRRLVKVAQLLQRLAVSDGRTTVDPVPDFLVLEHCLWMDDPTDRVRIRDWIWDHVTPLDNSSSREEGTRTTTTTTTTPQQLQFLLHTVRQELLETLQRTGGALDLSMDTNATKTTTDVRSSTSTANGSEAVLVHPEDSATLEVLRQELERITSMAQQNLQRLIRHRELVRQLSPTSLASSSSATTTGYLWMDPEEAKTVQQILLPKAELLVPMITQIVHDAVALSMAVSSAPNKHLRIPNAYRIEIIERMWHNSNNNAASNDTQKDNGVHPNSKLTGGSSNTPLSSNNSNISSSSGGGYYRDFTPTELDTNSRDAKSKYDTQTYRRWKRAKKKAK